MYISRKSEKFYIRIESDLNDLKATIMQDKTMQNAMPGNVDPEVINKVLIPKIIRVKYPELSDEEVEEVAESFFRSQQTWDATMAGSVARHHPRNGTSILLVGQFHSNNNGGTVQMLRRLMPGASILVVCLRADQDDPPDDPPPADLLIETWVEAR